ncbi:hypothetical protein BRY73_22480 [Ochrobactrum sp. P6BS-III]|uniref:hypothetical protein n=1 Tax=unclassified Ochrobactrum TaxID=239106 RepID=UPI000992642D|nr:hypothetical protein [Ochrobactrum sp. P6BSIII]OOL14843.1 hypothetical protein BRY73_22480 [Ochrobactrum sp. P6BS-III]
MEKRKRSQKSCAEIALVRARQARRQNRHPVVVGWVFIAALLSIRTPVMLPATPYPSEAENDWPISDYERGYSTSPKPRRERYNTQPSMKRLMRDLRRPAAREDAMQFLLARIDNVGLRGWVIKQIREDQINRLSIHVHPGLPDTAIIASWQAELNAENTTDSETINDGLQTQQSPTL